MLIDGTKIRADQAAAGQNAPTLGASVGSTLNNATGSSTGQAQAAKGGVGSKSGQWTNLQDYVSANNGGNNNTVKKINNQVDQYNNDFQNTLGVAKQAGQKASDDIGQVAQTQSFVKDAFKDPNAFTANQDNVNKFNNFKTNFNATPADSINQFNSAAAPAIQSQSDTYNKLNNLRSDGGMTDYLRQSRNPEATANRGGILLDKFLVNNTDEGKSALGSADEKSNSIKSDSSIQNLRDRLLSSSNALDNSLMSGADISKYATDQRTGYEQGLGPLDKNRLQNSLKERYFGGDESRLAEGQNVYNQARQTQNMIDLNDRAIRFNNNANYEELTNAFKKDPTQQGVLGFEAYNVPTEISAQLHSLNGYYRDTPWYDMSRPGYEAEASEIVRNYKNRDKIAQNADFANQLASIKSNSLYSPANDYNSRLASGTNQYAMTPQEEARYRALSTLSGYDANDFLNRGI